MNLREHAPQALAGGALIGLAAAALLVVNGRVFGVSGIVNGILDRATDDRGWRVAAVIGLVGGALLVAAWSGVPPPRSGFPAWALVLGGLLVGYGTRLGNGCTSGHGICGIARFSSRSIVATVVFVGAGMATVFLIRHVAGVLP